MTKKKMLERDLIITELTTEGFIEAKNRLENSPTILEKFEKEGIEKRTVLQLPFGLNSDGELFIPIYDDEKYAVGSCKILDFNTISPLMRIESFGCLGMFSPEKSNLTLYVVNSIIELCFMWQEGYDNVILLIDQEKIPNRVFSRYSKIVMLHNDLELKALIRRKVYCCYLREEYRGGQLPDADLMVESDVFENINTNPFIIGGKLSFLFGGNSLYVRNKDEQYIVTYGAGNKGHFNYEGNTVKFNVKSIRHLFKKEEVNYEDVYQELYKYLYDNLYFCSKEQVMTITYYVLSTYVSPHFLCAFDLQVFFQSYIWFKIFNIVLKKVVNNYTLSYGFDFKQPEENPIIRMGLTSEIKHTMGISLVLDESTGSGNHRLMSGIKIGPEIKNKIINWALEYEPHIYKGDYKESRKNQFGMIVRNRRNMSEIEDVVKGSEVQLLKMQKNKFKYSLTF